jgi:hypothetical protein
LSHLLTGTHRIQQQQSQASGLGGSAVVLTSKAEMAYSYQQNAPLAYRLAKQVYTADPFDERSVRCFL